MSRRRSVGNVVVSGVSPQEEYEKPLNDLKSVGLKLNYGQTVELRDLLNQALEDQAKWDYLNITGYRQTNQVTVTYYEPVR